MFNDTLEELYKEVPVEPIDPVKEKKEKIKKISEEIIFRNTFNPISLLVVFTPVPWTVGYLLLMLHLEVIGGDKSSSPNAQFIWIMGWMITTALVFWWSFTVFDKFLYKRKTKKYNFDKEKKQMITLFNLLTEKPYEIRVEYQNEQPAGRRFKVVVERNEVQDSFVVKEKSENFTAYFNLNRLFRSKYHQTDNLEELQLIKFVDHIAHKANQWDQPAKVKKVIPK